MATNRVHSEETRQKISENHADMSGPNNGMFKHSMSREFLEEEYINKKKSASQIAKDFGCCKRTIIINLTRYNIPRRPKSQAWKGKRLTKKMLQAIGGHKFGKQNKQEKYLEYILGSQYRYVGSGGLIIDGLIPDFVHISKMKIVELYGEFWHTNRKSDERRVESYKKEGYETLIIWSKELKDIELLRKKISDFTETL